jgi:hypothetical protein
MALAANNITPRKANTELGSPFGTTPSNLSVSDVVGYATQNKFSFYGPGVLSTDANKDMVLTVPTSNYKLGDFRSYNNSAATPAAFTNFQHNYTGTSPVNITLVSLPAEMNVLAADSSATYITYNAYLTTKARSGESSRFDQDINPALFTTITPLTGHSRNQSSKIHATHVDTFVGMTTSTLSKPDDYIYMDTFFSNVSGTRLVNLGSVAGGYSQLTMHQQQNPWVDSVGTCVSRSGYTGSHTEINNVASSCTGADVPLSLTNKNYSFYLRAVGISTGLYNINPTNCTVRIRHYEDDGTTIRETITLTGQNLNTFSKNGKQFSGTLTNQPTYDEFLKVDITVVSSWGTAYLC